MKKAIVIGSSSGIGRELAKILSRQNYIVGLVGRRIHLLEEVSKEIENISFIKQIDIASSDGRSLLNELISEMGGVDLIVINAGIGTPNPDLHWSLDKETIDINISGFAAMANASFHHFRQKGAGHLVGISSIIALRGSRVSPAYSASKAFVSNYLQGLRWQIAKLGLPIAVTDIKPGYVETAMIRERNSKFFFWVASPQKAARQIFKAIAKKRKYAYITRRWRIVGWALRIVPDYIYNKL